LKENLTLWKEEEGQNVDDLWSPLLKGSWSYEN
jgi:hypothetical protein